MEVKHDDGGGVAVVVVVVVLTLVKMPEANAS